MRTNGIGANVNVFYALCRKYQIPIACPEYRFDKTRRWRMDYAWPEQRVALEVEGGVWIRGGGRHNRGRGYLNDMEKYSEAAAQGWRIIRVTPDQLCTLETIELLKRALAYTPDQHAA